MTGSPRLLTPRERLHQEYVVGETDRFVLYASDLNGFRIVRKRDGASAIFAGDDQCERFRDHFSGDECPDESTNAQSQAEATDSVGTWAGLAGEFGWIVEGDKTKPLPVIFRINRGELCAYFPTESWDAAGNIASYAPVGQHGAASREWLRKGRLATEAEYRDLLRELRGIYETHDAEHIPLKVYRRDPSRLLARHSRIASRQAVAA